MAHRRACGSPVHRILGHIESVLLVGNWAYGCIALVPLVLVSSLQTLSRWRVPQLISLQGLF